MKRLTLLLAPAFVFSLITGCGSTIKKYKVSFDLNEGVGEIPVQEVKENECAIEPEKPLREPDKTFRYEFKEWRLDGEKFNFSTPITKDITLVANWTRFVKETFTVTFMSDGYVYTEKEVKYNEKVSKPKDPTKDPSPRFTYKFLYWGDKEGEFNFDTPITMDTTLNAHYEMETRKYTVTFINDETIYKQQEAEYLEKIEKPEDPTKEGETFSYWADYWGFEYSFPFKVYESVVLYAIY